MIVKEAEQERAATVDQRAVQRVPGPQLVAACSASNRPSARATALPFHGTPAAFKWRWIVRADGAAPSASTMIRWICAAVRAGCSRRSATANSKRSGVPFASRRGAGTSASNPP